MLNWGRNWGRGWGRDICCECQPAVCIGPHHRGKKRSSCRTGGTGARGSARFRPGTGDRERSDSAMDAQTMSSLVSLRGKQNCKFTRFNQSQWKRNQNQRKTKTKTSSSSKIFWSCNAWNDIKTSEMQKYMKIRLEQPCIFDQERVQDVPRKIRFPV